MDRADEKAARSSIERRIWNKISPEPNSGCWLWIGAVSTQGYARIWDGQRMQQAHRLMYEISRGKIPDELVLDHLCRVRSCVNPNHLEIVTQRENVRRGIGTASKTHCPRGHSYSGKNLYRLPETGYRRCRKCWKIHKQRYRDKKKPDVPLKQAAGFK